MTSRAPSRQASRQSDAEREIERAEQDYRRLRQAYLELARGPDNQVALAMVGADMERANTLLRNLGGLRQLPFGNEPGRDEQQQHARRLAEEDA
jgi:hypothetical protein